MKLSPKIRTHNLINYEAWPRDQYWRCTICGIIYDADLKIWSWSSIFILEQTLNKDLNYNLYDTCNQFIICKAKKLEILNNLGHIAKYNNVNDAYCERCNTGFFLSDYGSDHTGKTKWYFKNNLLEEVISCDLFIMKAALE